MLSSSKIFRAYSIAILLGVLVGFRFIPPALTGIVYFFLIVKILYHSLRGEVEKVMTFFPYIIYLEIFVRFYVRDLPYLAVQYTYMFSFFLLLLKKDKASKINHFRGIGFLGLFFLLEIINGLTPTSPRMTSSIMLQSLGLLIPCVWAANNKINATIVNKVMDNVRIACVFLAGIVMVAHLQGKIDYNSASSSEASNGLAPVQLSGYLGVGCTFMLISILNSFDKRSKIIQLAFFAFVSVIMVLTFSRGGLYFMGFVTIAYLFFNRTNFGQYFKFIILIPVGLILYSFILNKTEGKVVDRYTEKGSSNRDKLVLVALYTFFEHPILGIGTGNYNDYIVKNKLFHVASGVHNEFARAAAEHGIFGIIFYWGFFITLLSTILKRPKPQNQFSLYFFILFCLITIHNGLKISVQPLMLMLSICIAPVDRVKIKNTIKNVSNKP